MDSRRFKEYKAIIEDAIRQAELTENVSIQSASVVPDDPSIFLSTNRQRECILMTDGPEIHVLKRIQHGNPTGSIDFKTYEVVNLAEPGSVLRLGVAIKDLLNFSYWSKTDELG